MLERRREKRGGEGKGRAGGEVIIPPGEAKRAGLYGPLCGCWAKLWAWLVVLVRAALRAVSLGAASC